jgi:hypothetical protein
MLRSDKITVRDGDDIIVQSLNLNIYSNELKVDILGFNFTFKFEKSTPKDGQRDIEVSGEAKNGLITVSSKIRNPLGGGSQEKLELVSTEKAKLLFTLYASKVGDDEDGLNITLTFYQRNL